jgi:hypothetical protein
MGAGGGRWEQGEGGMGAEGREMGYYTPCHPSEMCIGGSCVSLVVHILQVKR